jgi:hypothetical protein
MQKRTSAQTCAHTRFYTLTHNLIYLMHMIVLADNRNIDITCNVHACEHKSLACMGKCRNRQYLCVTFFFQKCRSFFFLTCLNHTVHSYSRGIPENRIHAAENLCTWTNTKTIRVCFSYLGATAMPYRLVPCKNRHVFQRFLRWLHACIMSRRKTMNAIRISRKRLFRSLGSHASWKKSL